MDFSDDNINMLDDQSLPFTPSWFPPSPDPFLELMQDPLMVETENVDEEFGELLFPVPAISEANPATSIQPQNPPDMEPDASTMQQQPSLSSSHGYLQQPDQQDLLNLIHTLNSFHEPDVSTMQQQHVLCDSHGYVLESLSNRQSMLNQNMINSFEEPNESTMINIVQQIEEENSGYAHQPLTDSFELPNHLQEQFLSIHASENYPTYPAYQHGPIGSHFNMYDHQPPPRVLTNREDEHRIPMMVTDLVMAYPLQNQVSMMPPQSQMPSSSTRTPQQNQISMLPPQSQISSRSIRTYHSQNQISVTSPQLQIPSTSIRRHGSLRELVSQPLPRFRCTQLDTSTQIRPCTNSFTSPLQTSSGLRRRKRNDQNHFVHGESSSSAQRKRIVLPKRNDDSDVVNLGEERMENTLYSPVYEDLGLAIDPIVRSMRKR